MAISRRWRKGHGQHKAKAAGSERVESRNGGRIPGLTPEESAYVELKVALGSRLKELNPLGN